MDDILKRARAYRLLAVRKDNAHYAMAEHLAKRHKLLGVPAVVTATIVSTAIFATLENEPAVGWKVATALLSLSAAVLAALQTFFNFAQQAERHHVSATGYSQLRRELERFDLRFSGGQSTNRDDALAELARISQTMDQLEQTSLPIATKIYNRVASQYIAVT